MSYKIESFDLGKASETDPISICIICKYLINKCKYYSSNKALCSAQENSEYRCSKVYGKSESYIGHLGTVHSWYQNLEYNS